MGRDEDQDVLGSTPSFSRPMALKAATERSMSEPVVHVGQVSATITSTDWPVLVLVMCTDLPQMSPERPYSVGVMAAT